MNNLVAYIPALNSRYLEWLKSKQPFRLYLVSGEMAKSLIPRLERNLIALSVEDVLSLLLGVRSDMFPRSSLNIFHPEGEYPNFSDLVAGQTWVLPDEDLSRLIADKYIQATDCQVTFESVWGRWDMSAVKRQEPVIPDLEVSTEEIDQLRIKLARMFAERSPDWWRQIGAFAFRGDELIAAAYNKHHPTEYETMLFGDPRINFDAGDPAGAEIYLSLHAEEGIITACADTGTALGGASVYVTTFPCSNCARRLAACHIKELFFADGYSILGGLESLQAADVRIVKVN